MIGKLKTLEEIKKEQKLESMGYTDDGIHVFHSIANLNIAIYKENYEKFGNIIDVEIWKEESNRVIYYDGVSKEKHDQLYYDEWFEWIGKKIEYIPDELWNIEDL